MIGKTCEVIFGGFESGFGSFNCLNFFIDILDSVTEPEPEPAFSFDLLLSVLFNIVFKHIADPRHS